MTDTHRIDRGVALPAQGARTRRREQDLAWFANATGELLAAVAGTPGSPMARLLQGMKATQALRAEYLPPACRSDTNWALVAALLLAKLEGRQVQMSSLGLAADIPYTTALNHIRTLIRYGYFRAVQDPRDRRRSYLELSPELTQQSEEYLQRIIDAGRRLAAPGPAGESQREEDDSRQESEQLDQRPGHAAGAIEVAAAGPALFRDDRHHRQRRGGARPPP